MRIWFALLLLVVTLLPAPGAAQWRTSVLPVLGSAPETGGQFGVAVFRTLQPEDSVGTRPSSLIGNAIVTSKGQQRAFVEYDRWMLGNERRLQLRAVVSKFPLPFYGFGDKAPDEPMVYEPRTLELSITRSRKSGSASWRYAGLRLVDTKVLRSTAFGDPPSWPPCDSLGCWSFSSFGPSRYSRDYRLALASAGWVRDTRDNLFAATRGGVFDASLTAGHEFTPRGAVPRDPLVRLRVDGRRYLSLPRAGVIAGQVVLDQAFSGSFPLDQIPMVGHNTLNRGYAMGRFRDVGMLASQIEWRSPTPFWNNRLGVAAFGGVAYLFGESDNNRPLPSGGLGLRFRLDPRTRSTIRVDYAVGASGQSGLYVAFNEAF